MALLSICGEKDSAHILRFVRANRPPYGGTGHINFGSNPRAARKKGAMGKEKSKPKHPFLDKAATYINLANRVTATIIAVVFILYAGLSLWDMYRSEMKAFASYDLLQYKPVLKEEPPYLEDLLKVNPDVVSWLTIYNTKIDYPVVQGKDDKEYLNKDAAGNYALWGALFISENNKSDYSDPYTLIYGHHVANGTMLGDIEKYKDVSFFNKNRKGVMVLPDRVYDLDVFAYIETDE